MGRRYEEEEIAFLLTQFWEEKLHKTDKRIRKAFRILFKRKLGYEQVDYVYGKYSDHPHYK